MKSSLALIAVMAIVFATYFTLRFAMPDMPLQVYQALASLPSQKLEVR